MLAVCFPKALALGAPINSLKKKEKKNNIITLLFSEAFQCSVIRTEIYF